MLITQIVQPVELNIVNLKTATHWLAERDAELAMIFEQYGYPPLWAREPTFSTLVHIILEQQVSLASANAAFLKLKNRLGEVSPEAFLMLDDAELREIGFSRQKTGYTRALAKQIVDGLFVLEKLHFLDDDTAKNTLKTLKGVGDWTADIYLSECLLRPDILPRGDIALLDAFKTIKKLDARPPHEIFEKMTHHWRPWRSVGIRLLWHFYLSEKNKK